MDWSSNKWLAPCHVKTPDVVADIAQFIEPGFTQAKLDSIDPDTRNKLTVLVERLEFIEHLSTLSAYMLRHKRVSTSQTPLADDRVKIVSV